MEKLKSWIAAQGISQRAAAVIFGLSPAGLHGLINGRNVPSVVVAIRIEDATGGAVTVRDWLQ